MYLQKGYDSLLTPIKGYNYSWTSEKSQRQQLQNRLNMLHLFSQMTYPLLDRRNPLESSVCRRLFAAQSVPKTSQHISESLSETSIETASQNIQEISGEEAQPADNDEDSLELLQDSLDDVKVCI